MKNRALIPLFPCLILALVTGAGAADKPRVFVLTDIENEPDDAMSMVRYLTYANHFDTEGLAATTSIHQSDRVAPQRIRRIVEAYGKVRDNLEKHEPGFPTGGHLLSLVTEGLPVYGMEGDTPSFLNFINNGLSDPEHPDWGGWGGWGGRYEHYTPRPQKWHLYPETRPIWSDADDEVLGVDGRWHDDNHIILAVTDHGTPRLTRYQRTIVTVVP